MCGRDDSGQTLADLITGFQTTWEMTKASVAEIDDGSARGIARTLWAPFICEVGSLFERERAAGRGEQAKAQVAELLHPLLMEGSLYAMSLKPAFGYKGDSQVIDRVTENTLEGNGASRVMDASYQECIGGRVVRSRLLFLTEYLATLIGPAYSRGPCLTLVAREH